MDTPTDGTERDGLGRLGLAALGWAALTVEAIDELADELARRVRVDRAEMRETVQDVIGSWRREVERVGLRRDEVTERTLLRLGLARREEVEDLALRVAQLEHRLKLLERE